MSIANIRFYFDTNNDLHHRPKKNCGQIYIIAVWGSLRRRLCCLLAALDTPSGGCCGNRGGHMESYPSAVEILTAPALIAAWRGFRSSSAGVLSLGKSAVLAIERGISPISELYGSGMRLSRSNIRHGRGALFSD